MSPWTHHRNLGDEQSPPLLCHRHTSHVKIMYLWSQNCPKILHTKVLTHTVDRSFTETHLNTFFFFFLQKTLNILSIILFFFFFCLYSYLCNKSIDDRITLIPTYYFTNNWATMIKNQTISFFLYSGHLIRVRFGTTQ